MDTIELLMEKLEALSSIISRQTSTIVSMQRRLEELERKSGKLEERNVIFADFKKKKSIDEL